MTASVFGQVCGSETGSRVISKEGCELFNI